MTPPKVVRDLVVDLRKVCPGADPVVEWDYRLKHWWITVSNDRVVMTLNYRMHYRNRWVWAGSTLIIDGVQVPITCSFEHFARVWRNPEELPILSPSIPPFSAPIQETSLDSMPLKISREIRKEIRDHKIPVPRVGHADENFWVAEYVFPRAILRVYWFRFALDPALHKDFHLVIDGEDKSELVQGKLDKAFALIAQAPHPGAPDPAGVDGVAGSSRDRGVEVRATHVMRN